MQSESEYGTYGWSDLAAKYREFANLTPMKEDTIEVSKTMRAASPPASATDLLEAQNDRRSQRPLRRVRRVWDCVIQ